MANLEHLMRDKPIDTYTLQLGDDITRSVADAMARTSIERLAPFVEALLSATQTEAKARAGSAKAHSDALKAARKAFEQAVAAESKVMQDTIKEAVKTLQETSEKGRKAQLAGLVQAFDRIKLPDHSEQLARIEATQAALAAKMTKLPKPEPRATEWDFDINRNREGFIQSVTAKAK
jgi:hypothetical protein